MNKIINSKTFTLLLIIVVTPMLIGIVVTVPGFFSSDNDWIGFFGSYIGGVIGALVALLIVRIQINTNLSEKNNQKELNDNSILYAVIYDLKNIQRSIDNLTNIYHNQNFPEGLDRDAMFNADITIPTLDNEIWIRINYLYDHRIMLELIDFRKYHNQNSENIKSRIVYKFIEKELLEFRISKIEKKKNKNFEDLNEMKRIQEDLFLCSNEIELKTKNRKNSILLLENTEWSTKFKTIISNLEDYLNN